MSFDISSPNGLEIILGKVEYTPNPIQGYEIHFFPNA